MEEIRNIPEVGTKKQTDSLIPWPMNLQWGVGSFVIPHKVNIHFSEINNSIIQQKVINFGARINELIDTPVQWGFDAVKLQSQISISVAKDVPELPHLHINESYTLMVTEKEIKITAVTHFGLNHALTTLIQLVNQGMGSGLIPQVKVTDKPRFKWRGLLIDVVRHWIPISVIKRNIEGMALVKLNVLHWHLTNDQGFRVESKRYPKLHEMGSGGLFYTQKEIKEVVSFAAQRGIRVVPEFDIPGHCMSWLVGYPHLSGASRSFEIATHFGGLDAVMDPSNEEVYKFLTNFFEEMTSLFPDKYIHIGADQVKGPVWMANPKVNQFMKSRGMEHPPQLLHYFVSRVGDILHNLGKTMIGWDPILHSGLSKNSVVQSVRGQKYVVDAVTLGYHVIASSEYYLDVLQPARFMYKKDPLDDLDDISEDKKSLVLGGEVAIWTEFVDANNLDARVWPRAAAVAERLWSSAEIGGADDLYARLDRCSDLLLNVGLTHQSSPEQMLQELVGNDDINSLRTISKLLYPDFMARWNNPDYTTDTPLNRLVDISDPDSHVIRKFKRKMIQFMYSPPESKSGEVILKQFEEWLSLKSEMERMAKTNPRLNELTPLLALFFTLINSGVSMVKHIQGLIQLNENEKESITKALEEADQPIAELRIAFLPAIRALFKRVNM